MSRPVETLPVRIRRFLRHGRWNGLRQDREIMAALLMSKAELAEIKREDTIVLSSEAARRIATLLDLAA